LAVSTGRDILAKVHIFPISLLYYLPFIPLTSASNLLAARPQYRKRKASQSSEFSVRGSSVGGSRLNTSMDPPAMFMPNLAPSRSVREAIQEVKMVQVSSFSSNVD